MELIKHPVDQLNKIFAVLGTFSCVPIYHCLKWSELGTPDATVIRKIGSPKVSIVILTQLSLDVVCSS